MEAGSHLEPAFVVPSGLADAQLWLIRHGETEWSRSGQHTSRTDVPLTANGERQASALRGMLVDVHPVFVLCSPRQRAVRTAQLAGLAVEGFARDVELVGDEFLASEGGVGSGPRLKAAPAVVELGGGAGEVHEAVFAGEDGGEGGEGVVVGLGVEGAVG